MGYFVPELGYQEYYLAKKHKQMGHDVYVIASDMLYPHKGIERLLKDIGAKNTSRKRKAGYSIIDGLKVYRLPHIIEYTDFILCIGLGKVLKNIKPDVVFAHESRQGLASQAAFYKKKMHFKLIVDQHDFYHKIQGVIKPILRNIEYFGFRKFLIDYNFRKADKIIAVTKATRNFLIKTHKINPQRIMLIELGTDTGLFYPRQKESAMLRKRIMFKKDDIILMFAGIIVRRKKLEMLIDVFSKIHDSYKIKLIIVGNGEKKYINEIKKLVKELKIENKVVFTGFIRKEELPVYYSMADIGVWHANNSLSILDGMACKLPIVIADLKLSQYASHGNGFKIPVGNKKMLKDSLVKLIKNKRLREKMGNESYKAVMKYYSYSIIGKKFIESAK